MRKKRKSKIAKIAVGVAALFIAITGSKDLKAQTISGTEELVQEEVIKGGSIDDSKLTGKIGYFTINIDGDKQTSMKIKVEYSSLDVSKSQAVKLTPVSESATNNHNLKIKSVEKTKQGSTTEKEKADYENNKYTTDYNDEGKLIYKTKNYNVLKITFAYDKEPYTYASGEQVKSISSGRLNAKAYSWQNNKSSTLSKAVYHQSHTEEFTMQVNIANTGNYDAGGGTVEGEYTIHLKHPKLNVNFNGNGATSGTEGTQVYTYNESKDLWNVGGSTLNFARTGYSKVAGAEWNKKADGTDTSYNQDTSYAATSLKDFADGEEFKEKSVTLYAQWQLANAGYTVKHWKQKATGTAGVHDENNYELAETETFTAVSGSSVTPSVKSYSGYSSPPVQTAAVPADSSLVIHYYYDIKSAGYTVKHWKQKLSGTAGNHDENNYDLAETEAFSGQAGSTVTPTVKSYTGFSSPAAQSGTVAADSSLVINYYYDRKFYNVTVHAGTGIDSVSGGGTYLYGAAVNIDAILKEGYHWLNWTGTFVYGDKHAIFAMPGNDVDLTANGEANSYVIHFDPNGGMGHIDDIVTACDTDVALPDGAAAYKKYTLDGVNVTADVESGTISETIIFSERMEEDTEQEELFSEAAEAAADTEPFAETPELPENGAEDLQTLESESIETTETAEKEQNKDFDGVTPNDEIGTGEEITFDEETKQAEGVADKTVYASVFLGWALYEHKDDLKPQWKAGDVVNNLTVENNGEVTLYAVWDDCPWMEAHDLYYSLEQAQNGFITEEEILSHATATDREDGSPILPGVNPAANKPEVNTSFTIPDYQATEFTSMTHDAAVSENLTVTDSSGSTYRKQIMVYVVDTTPQEIKPKGQTRFINEYYYNQPYEYGGLEDNSIWKTNPEYRAVLEEAFENLKNDTPEEKYYFTHETVLEMKEYIREHGIGNSQEPDALQEFYERFLAPNRLNE